MAAALLLLALGSGPAAARAGGLLYYSPAQSHNVSFNERSAVIDGQPTFMLSGAVHYTRVHEREWERVFMLARELGLNTIQTYVFWNAHETTADQVGNASWEGRANLPRFIELAASHGLWVTVRIGPYICGEYYFGGIPTWVRESGATCFRCSDPIWEREAGRWVGVVVDKIRPSLASNGGNVVMLQIENEYNGGDPYGSDPQGYLQQQVDMARALTTAVPWNLCHDSSLCTKINTDNSTGKYSFKALCTINGFWMDEYVTNTHQPCPAWIRDLRAGNPGQPTIWTEDQGWFDQWGVAQRIRDPRDQLYGIARFVAHGGSWHNFYMVTGGNNYGKQSGGEVVTAYAPDTVIDYLLLRHQPRFDYYATFFRTLAEHTDVLLSAPVPAAQPLPAVPARGGGGANSSSSTAWALSLSACTDTDPAHIGKLDPSQQWALAADGVPTTVQHRASGLCLALGGSQSEPSLARCTADPLLQWTFEAVSGHIQSTTTRKCVSPHAPPGTKCHTCLDVKAGKSGTLDYWDCKPAESGQEDNQRFGRKQAESGITYSAKLCLTAAANGGGGAELSEYGAISFISNTADADLIVTYSGRQFYMENHSVLIVNRASVTPSVLFNSSVVEPVHPVAQPLPHTPLPPKTAALRTSEWQAFEETVAAGLLYSNISEGGPIEQLHFTHGFDTDYLFYVTAIAAAEKYTIKITGAGSGTIFYTYVDGVLLDSTAPDKRDSHRRAGSYTASGVASPPSHLRGLSQPSPLPQQQQQPRTASLQILSTAMGLSNGGVGPTSRKGLFASGPLAGSSRVLVNGVDVTTDRAWEHRWMLKGEHLRVFTEEGGSSVPWRPAAAIPGTATLVWFKATFDLPAAVAAPVGGSVTSHNSSQSPAQLSYALHLVGMTKGVAYVNGFELGRYWLRAGQCTGKCAPPVKNGHCYMHWKGCGEPTQSLYHVPTPVLKPTGNLVVLFEETASVEGNQPRRNLEGVKLLALTAHPQ
jgi:hypothetical protein